MGMKDQNEETNPRADAPREQVVEADSIESEAMSDTEEPEIVETNLADELEMERARSAEYLDQAQRARAEMINYRRRMEQEMQVTRRYAAEHVIARLLPVIDDFHRAINAVPEQDRDNPWVQGMLLIERKMWSVLESEGVKPIDAVGKPFDPSLHEAVSVESDGGNIVVEEFQRGYMLHDRLIRPAMVKVGQGKTDSPEMNA
ncbi:MAG TPA: nucleotide exchange factor GrpE [Nitrolancea sp.]|jgi:molecular chaperone GrpE|nr:nucleotide exchange factor GrpE [Nitrolancea sp.]